VEHLISNLLKHYENGALTRRQLVYGMAALVVGSRTESVGAQAKGFVPSTINHVSILCTDVKRSSEWYQRVLGLSVRTATGAENVRLGVGSSHLTLRPVKPFGTADHICLGVDKFNQESVVRDLKERGTSPQEGGATGFSVKDPDGYPIQLQDSSTL
jgi:catechol 2,3-dioxygenase-like lactoylglutathione lyase family enzyme